MRDLLGGDYFNGCFRGNCHSDFWTEADAERRLGDKIHYHNENDVNWIGVHLQAEKSSPAGSFYGMAGWSRNTYDFTDFFTRGDGGGPLELSSGGLTGYQIKGGAVRNMGPEWSVYGNAGLVSKVPIFDGVIDDVSGEKYDDAKNEAFTSLEIGARYRSLNRKLSLDVNVYFTQWNDRTRRQFIRDYIDEQDGLVTLRGVDARHMGVEVEGALRPAEFLRFDGALSFGEWKHTNDPMGDFRRADRQGEVQDVTFFLNGLYVGDAPQFQAAYAVSVFPTGGLYMQIVGKTFGKHYANWTPYDRILQANAGIQSWNPPGYTKFDLHASYRLPSEMVAGLGGNVRLFIHGFNIFDAVYVQDAVDNSQYNAYWDSNERDLGRLSHKADDAEVFLGYPRNFNFGFQIYH